LTAIPIYLFIQPPQNRYEDNRFDIENPATVADRSVNQISIFHRARRFAHAPYGFPEPGSDLVFTHHWKWIEAEYAGQVRVNSEIPWSPWRRLRR
jgi:hypothetical protein